jgi:hypothetical protein
MLLDAGTREAILLMQERSASLATAAVFGTHSGWNDRGEASCLRVLHGFNLGRSGSALGACITPVSCAGRGRRAGRRPAG